MDVATCGRAIEVKLKTDLKQSRTKKKKKCLKNGHTVLLHTPTHELRYSIVYAPTLDHTTTIQVIYADSYPQDGGGTHAKSSRLLHNSAMAWSPPRERAVARDRWCRVAVVHFIDSFARRVQTCAVLCPQTGHSRPNKT